MASEKKSLPVSASLDQQVGAGHGAQAAGAGLSLTDRQQPPSSAPCEPSSDLASSPWRSWTRHSISVAPCPEQSTPGQSSMQPAHPRKACTTQNSRQETPLEVKAVDEAAAQQRSRRRGSSLRGQRFLGYDGLQRADSPSDSEEGPSEAFRGRVGGGQIRRHSFRVPRPSNGYEVTQPQPQHSWTSNRPPPAPLPPSHHGWGGEALHVTSDRLINIQ